MAIQNIGLLNSSEVYSLTYAMTSLAPSSGQYVTINLAGGGGTVNGLSTLTLYVKGVTATQLNQQSIGWSISLYAGLTVTRSGSYTHTGWKATSGASGSNSDLQSPYFNNPTSNTITITAQWASTAPSYTSPLPPTWVQCGKYGSTTDSDFAPVNGQYNTTASGSQGSGTGKFRCRWGAGTAGTNNAIQGYTVEENGSAFYGSTYTNNVGNQLYFDSSGWYSGACGKTYRCRVLTRGANSNSAYSTAYGDVHFEAEVPTYTITLDPNGGTISSTTLTGTYGNVLEPPTPTRTGYNFKGWYKEYSASSSDSTNYGKAHKYTGFISISFWTYASSYTTTKTTEQTILSCTQGSGYGFFIEADGSKIIWGVKTASGGSWENAEYSTSNISAGYHFWNLIFTGSGKQLQMYMDGTLVATKATSGTSIYYVSGTNLLVGGEPDSSGGVEWSNWAGQVGSLVINNSAEVRSEEDTIGLAQCPNQALTLKARWEPKSYTVSVNLNGGTGGPGSSFTATYGTNKSLTAPTRAGYDFVGWACVSGSRLSQDFSAATGFFTSAPTKYIWGGSGTNNSTIALATMDTASGFPNTLKMITITEPGTSTKGVGFHRRATGLAENTNYLITFVAKAPLSTYFYIFNNASYEGTGYTWEYLTPMAGTGNWQTYCIKLKTGTSITNNYTGYYVLCGDATTVSTSTCPGNISYNIAWTSIGLYTKFNGACTYVPGDLSSDTIYAIWIEKKYTISYALNSGTLASGTDSIIASGSYKIAVNPLSAQWNRSPYALGTASALGTGKPTANSPGYYFRVERPTKASTVSTVTTTYTTTFNATANGGASNSTKNNTKTVTTTTPQNLYSWTITGMDNSTHQYWGRANSGVTTNSAQSFTSTSITVTGANYTDGGVPYTYRNLRQSAGTVTFTAGWTPGTATSSTVTTSITFPAIPTKANSTASSAVTTSFSYNGASGTTPSAITSSGTATVTWTANKWWTTQSSGGTSYSAGTTITPTSSTTYYARYTASTGTFTYASITMPAAPSSVKPDTTATKYVVYDKNTGTTLSAASTSFVATTKYKFGGWTTSASGTSGLAAGAAFTPTATATRYAAWAVSTTTAASITTATATKANTTATATITYNLNTGTTVSPASATYTVTSSWAGAGWYTAASGGTKRADMGAKYTPPIAGETVYAHWTESKSAASITLPVATKSATTANKTVTFNANGGTVSTASTTFVVTTSYVNSQWNIGSTTGTKLGNAGAQVTAPTASTTVYAIWTSSQSAASVATPIPTKKGYFCSGWYTAATGGTKRANAGANYTPPVAGETIYAQWYKCCYVYKTSDSKWHAAIPYVYKSGWKRAEPYVYKSSTWK